MILARREYLDEELLCEALPLIKASADEVEDGPELDMDITGLLEAERMGEGASYTLRSDEQLIGYLHVCLSRNMHYRTSIMAIVDSIYLLPDFRKGSLARQFIRRVEEDLKDLHVSTLAFYIKVNHDYENLFLRMAYTCSEKIYVKDLYGTPLHSST